MKRRQGLKIMHATMGRGPLLAWRRATLKRAAEVFVRFLRVVIQAAQSGEGG